MIQLTENARIFIRKALKAKCNMTPVIKLKQGGCAGNILYLDLTQDGSNINKITIDDIDFIIDTSAIKFIEDITIDIKEGLSPEVVIKNNKADTCRCGKSFRS